MKKPESKRPDHSIKAVPDSSSNEEPRIINEYLKPNLSQVDSRRVFIKKLGSVLLPTMFLPSMLACEDELQDTYQTEKEQVLKPSHQGNTFDLVAIDNATKIISGGTEGTIKVWDSNSQSLIETISFDNAVTGICADGSEKLMLVMHGAKHVSIISLGTFSALKTIDIDFVPVSCALSPDGSLFAVENGSKIHIYRISDGALMNEISSELCHVNRKKILFVGDSSKIACINYKDVKVFDSGNGDLLATFAMPWKTMFTCLKMSRDAKTLVCGNKKGFQAFNSSTFELEVQYYAGGGSITNSDSIEFSLDDKSVFISNGQNILTINRSNGEVVNTAFAGTPYMKEYTSLANHKIAAVINVGSANSDINLSFIGIWDTASGSIINSCKDEQVEVTFEEGKGGEYLSTSCNCDVVCRCDRVCDCLGVCTCDSACNSHDSCPSHKVPNCRCQSVGQCACYSVCMINY